MKSLALLLCLIFFIYFIIYAIQMIMIRGSYKTRRGVFFAKIIYYIILYVLLQPLLGFIKSSDFLSDYGIISNDATSVLVACAFLFIMYDSVRYTDRLQIS